MIVANLQQMLRLDQSTRCTLSSLFGGGGRFNCVLVEPGINCCLCYQRQSINRSHIIVCRRCCCFREGLREEEPAAEDTIITSQLCGI